jgi:hypothetical protein
MIGEEHYNILNEGVKDVAKCFCIAFILFFIFCQYEQRACKAESKRQNEQSTANQNISTPTLAQPTVAPSKPLPTNSQEGERGQAANDTEKPMTRAEIWAIVLSVLTLILIAFQCGIYWKQLGVMRELKAISERQAATFDKQADKMQGQWDVMKQQEGVFEKQVGVMRGQLDVMRQTIAENRHVFYVGERAYVGISHIQLIVNLREGLYPRIQIVIINGGRTPAWDVRIQVRMSVEDPTSDKSRGYLETADYAETRSIARVFLPSKTEIITVASNFSISHEMDKEINGLSAFFVRGEIYFTDISEEEQTQPFCFVWESKTSSFENCKQREKQTDNENVN